jgi:hypothetical protein
MVLKLLIFPRPVTFYSQNLIFPTINPLLVVFSNDLINFIGPRSWLLFDLFKLTDEKIDWIRLQRTAGMTWPVSDSRKKFKKIIHHFN